MVPRMTRMARSVTVARCGDGGDMVQGRKCAVVVPSLDCHLRYLVLVPIGFLNLVIYHIVERVVGWRYFWEYLLHGSVFC